MHHVFVLNTLIMLFTGIKGKRKLTARKRNKNLSSFLALNMTQIVKSNIFTLEMFEVLTFCPFNCQLVFRNRASRFLAFSKLTLISILL